MDTEDSMSKQSDIPVTPRLLRATLWLILSDTRLFTYCALGERVFSNTLIEFTHLGIEIRHS